MCGIVGLFLKDKDLEPRLGDMLTDMLITMSDRGPDSAGIAIYSDETDGYAKLMVQSNTPGITFDTLDSDLRKRIKGKVSIEYSKTGVIVQVVGMSAFTSREPQVAQQVSAIKRLSCTSTRLTSIGPVIVSVKKICTLPPVFPPTNCASFGKVQTVSYVAL